MNKLLLSIILISVLSGCDRGGSGSEQPLPDEFDLSEILTEEPESSLPENWWQQAVFYQVFVRSFYDSDGDGSGDIRGLIEKLDYIESLGAKGIWLMPITESYYKLNGYDVANHRALEPTYGSLDDFQELLDEAHRRGIGIIIDYVMNHASEHNPLFLNSKSTSSAEYRSWFNWADSNPGWQRWDGMSTWFNYNGDYYFGVFNRDLPDFDLTNQDVLNYHYSNMRYWLNMGVDGFRFDAVGQFVENGEYEQQDQPETYAILQNIQALLADYDNRYLVCEGPTNPVSYMQETGCGRAFTFGLNYNLVESALYGYAQGAAGYDYWYANGVNYSNTATFLANHDPFAGYRLMEQFDGDEARYKLAASILLTMPGQPFIYYGEEIGLRHIANENNADFAQRAPMSWNNNSATGGFTSGSPYRHLAANVTTHNVEMEELASDSLLNSYKELIALRNNNPALQNNAGIWMLHSFGDTVLQYLRHADEQTALVLINLSTSDETVELDLSRTNPTYAIDFAGSSWQAIYPAESTSTLSADSEQLLTVTLPALTMRVYQFDNP